MLFGTKHPLTPRTGIYPVKYEYAFNYPRSPVTCPLFSGEITISVVAINHRFLLSLLLAVTYNRPKKLMIKYHTMKVNWLVVEE
ncbi:hypothetical protein NSMS1_34470 [Nostoc sp. MS1]|nr:hypothetical protein NSMS1_34470 [Nostoc sp. MS1]